MLLFIIPIGCGGIKSARRKRLCFFLNVRYALQNTITLYSKADRITLSGKWIGYETGWQKLQSKSAVLWTGTLFQSKLDLWWCRSFHPAPLQMAYANLEDTRLPQPVARSFGAMADASIKRPWRSDFVWRMAMVGAASVGGYPASPTAPFVALLRYGQPPSRIAFSDCFDE